MAHAQKKKDLTAADGHLILVEYLEERPLLLSRQGSHAFPGTMLQCVLRACVLATQYCHRSCCGACWLCSQAVMAHRASAVSAAGMGLRLSTYYRKRNPTDAGHQKLIKGTPLKFPLP